ncbi:venom carboxylesterase-6-like [Ostrinia furnacalis]|nr:venom carboxylesterase-6-like [Ostrinia furnacalis]
MSGFDIIAPVTYYYDNSPYADEITKKIKEKYLKDDSFETLKWGILQMYTDSYFAYPALEAVEQTLSYSKSPIYLYELAYRATNSFSEIFGDLEGDYGVCHADDLMHLFPIHFLSKQMSPNDIEMGKLIRNMFTNFATSGNPNKPVSIPAKWEPATSGSKMEYLEIGSEQTMRLNLASRSKFWDNLPLWHNLRSRKFIDEL